MRYAATSGLLQGLARKTEKWTREEVGQAGQCSLTFCAWGQERLSCQGEVCVVLLSGLAIGRIEGQPNARSRNSDSQGFATKDSTGGDLAQDRFNAPAFAVDDPPEGPPGLEPAR
jgi:hypothetical protein